jgi:hypothetical protein
LGTSHKQARRLTPRLRKRAISEWKLVIIPPAGSDPPHHYLFTCLLAESANYRDEGVALLQLELEFSGERTLLGLFREQRKR